MKKFAIAAALVAVSLTSLAAQDAKAQKLGAGVTQPDALAISDLYAAPEKFVGKTIRIDGIAADVCTEMGCWIAIASEQQPALIVRVKVEDGGPIVFPESAKGKKVSAEGVFEKMDAGDKHSMEAMAEQKAAGMKADMFGKMYQLKGLGAYVY